jgi:hypothetical protein
VPDSLAIINGAAASANEVALALASAGYVLVLIVAAIVLVAPILVDAKSLVPAREKMAMQLDRSY